MRPAVHSVNRGKSHFAKCEFVGGMAVADRDCTGLALVPQSNFLITQISSPRR